MINVHLWVLLPTDINPIDELLKGLVQIAREHQLVLLADEVYDKVLYDGARHTALGSLSSDVLTLTFNSLSKSYRACGYRAGWMVISGDKSAAQDYIEGVNMLASERAEIGAMLDKRNGDIDALIQDMKTA